MVKETLGCGNSRCKCNLKIWVWILFWLEEESSSSSVPDNGKAVDGEAKSTVSPVDPLKKEKDKKAKNLICSCLTNLVLRKVMRETTALGVWKALEKDYQTKTLPNRIYLKQRFASFKMEEHKSVEDNLDVFLRLVDDLASLNINVSDEDQAVQILSSLPKQYDSLVHTLKYGNGKETLTLHEVTTSAYAKEVELKESGLLGKAKSGAEALVVSRGRSKKKSSWQNRGRSKSKDTRSKSRPKNGTKPRKCWTCGEEGHYKKDCPEQKNGKQSNSANVAHEKEQPMILTASIQGNVKEWVMDSGCTFHITPDRDALFDFKEVDGGKVTMGNNTYSEVKGIGKLKIINSEGGTVILTDVRYMPSMGKNLISYGQLERNGCKYEGKDFIVTFYKGGQKVISGKYRDGLYYLLGTVVKVQGSTGQGGEISRNSVSTGQGGEISESSELEPKGLPGNSLEKCVSLLNVTP
ncbi:unnamed protein product [Microthlaspi erraticum]|uniref:CCHC-type domain-containing protein n=1 Tax=Microthlaspi erraticum TaxID=1685480 RepID=A0A6D2I4J2_9BRAS|nr:unnamed protein product [Microthlaspi erraticum]